MTFGAGSVLGSVYTCSAYSQDHYLAANAGYNRITEWLRGMSKPVSHRCYVILNLPLTT